MAALSRSRRRHQPWVGLLLGGLALLEAGPGAGAERVVDVALVMAVDGSASISGGTLEFQLRGHAAAFRDQAVIAAMTRGPRGAVAVTLVRYAGPGPLAVLVPWMVVDGPASAARVAEAIAGAPRQPSSGNTALGNVIDRAVPWFDSSGVAADRNRIDLVGNGFSNGGVLPEGARDRAVSAGITISALAILDEYPWLAGYYEESVIGGPGAFVLAVTNPGDFALALRRKLVLEVAGRAE